MSFYKEESFKETEIGEIPKSWQVGKLENYAYIKGRIGWRGLKASEYTEQGPFLIANKHITNNKILWEKCDHLSEFRYNESPEIQLKANDVIISKDGTIGEAAILESLPEKATINSTMMLLRVTKNTLFPKFLFYFLQSSSFMEFISRKVAGTSIPHLFQRDMKNLNIVVPSRGEQEAVSEVLSRVDLAIQKTGEVIAKTERLKKGLMQQLLTKGIGHKEFKDTKIGRIPVDWQVVSLADVFKLASGKPRPENISPKADPEMPYPVYGGNGVMGYASRFLLDRETVVIGRVGEYCGAVDKSSKFSWITDNALYANKFTTDQNLDFLVYLLTFLNLNKFKKKMGQPLLTQKIVYSIRIPFPSLLEQRHISSILLAVDNKLQLEKSEKTKLERIKRGLMDLLFTGKIRAKVD